MPARIRRLSGIPSTRASLRWLVARLQRDYIIEDDGDYEAAPARPHVGAFGAITPPFRAVVM